MMKTFSIILIVIVAFTFLNFDTSTNASAAKIKSNTAFGAYLNSNITVPNFTETTLAGWTEEYDNGNGFNPATGEFTVPKKGIYVITTKIRLFKDVDNVDNIPVISRIRVNGNVVPGFGQKFDRVTLGNSYGEDVTLSTQIKLNKNDVVTLSITSVSGGSTVRVLGNSSSSDSFFTAVRVEK